MTTELRERGIAIARACIHPAWYDVGRPFFADGFVRGYYIGRSATHGWLPLVFALGFFLGLGFGMLR